MAGRRSKRATRNGRARTASARKPKSARKSGRVMVLVGTRKGAFIYTAELARRRWSLDGPHFLGQIVNHLILDPRDRETLLMASKTGHLGPTIFRSSDFGRNWKEASRPPAFPKAAEGEKGRAVDYTFFLSPAHESESASWYAGTSPRSLFRSDDRGDTWYGIDGLNNHPMHFKWFPPDEQTPDGCMLHSIIVDPRDRTHLYVSASGGGTFETTDGCASWRPLNAGVEAPAVPDPFPEYGQDPHCVALHPLRPDRLYQQNHCGIYRIDRPSDKWERIGRNMPAEVGDIGFPVVLHPQDPDTLWVIPMDGTTVWPRTSPDGKPAVYCSRNAGESWNRLDRGLPRRNAWLTTKRQAFASDALDPVGLYFGTTGGEVWMSANEGKSWSLLASRLPEIYSVSAAAVP